MKLNVSGVLDLHLGTRHTFATIERAVSFIAI